MRILIVKTSSLGDVLHTFPALTDAAAAVPGLHADWVVEESLAQIPRWHPAVDRVISVALRRWRHGITDAVRHELRPALRQLRANAYDLIIDAQGLVKSAVLTRLARGLRCGFAQPRESLAVRAYQRPVAVDMGLHAVPRTRSLFAASLGYPLPDTSPDYGLARERFDSQTPCSEPYLIFAHGTTWESKLWPERYWSQLARHAAAAGYAILLPWGDASERERAQRIAAGEPRARLLPRTDLNGLAAAVAQARAVAAVDTGIGHLSAALGVPCVSLYGATDPRRTGTVGANQARLAARFSCSPCLTRQCTYRGPAEVEPACYATVPPAKVWSTLAAYLDRARAPQQ